MAKRTRFASPLLFEEQDGSQFYCWPISVLLRATGRKSAANIAYWEKKGVIPEEYIIRVRIAPTIVAKYYTDRTVRRFRKWYGGYPSNKNIMFSTIRKASINLLFKEEYVRFKSATFIKQLGKEEYLARKEEKAKAELNDQYVHELHTRLPEEQNVIDERNKLNNEKDKDDWSIS